MEKIRKNSKQRKDAINNAKGIVKKSLENCFSGEVVESIPSFHVEDSTLYKTNEGYWLYIHSNLSYEWAA